MKTFPLFLALATAGLCIAEVLEVDATLREKFNLAPFYQKHLLVGEFPVVASAKVSDAALGEAGVIVRGMLAGRDDIVEALAENRIRLAVMAAGELTCDIPEHSDLTPKDHWNRRARGLGATRARPAVSCGEENLLNCEGDPYPGENILVHEFAHAIHLVALDTIDSSFDRRLKAAYDDAIARGKWKDTYAAVNHAEYWAEGVQSWFGTNRQNDAIHNHVDTRDELIEYDPPLAALCKEIFGDNPWQYRRADSPARKDELHLKNLDRSKLPKFQWPAKEAAKTDH
jgi:hypothetical protein